MSDGERRATAYTLGMSTRVFTLAQARRSLPGVAAVVIVLQRRMLRLDQLNALCDSMRRSALTDGQPASADDRELQAEIAKLEEHAHALIEHIDGLGVELKDPRRGLVDWIAERDGRHVYLCWQPGERTIGWWHEMAEGFAGRRPIAAEEWV